MEHLVSFVDESCVAGLMEILKGAIKYCVCYFCRFSQDSREFLGSVYNVVSDAHREPVESAHLRPVGSVGFRFFALFDFNVCSAWCCDGIGPTVDAEGLHQFVGEGLHRQASLPLCSSVNVHS